jgi:hypothetical protein
VPGADEVAVLQVGLVHSGAVQMGAVVAAHVDEPAARRVELDQEVDARAVAVGGRQLQVGVLRAAHEEGVMAGEGEHAALERPCGDREDEAHGQSLGSWPLLLT